MCVFVCGWWWIEVKLLSKLLNREKYSVMFSAEVPKTQSILVACIENGNIFVVCRTIKFLVS